jgi:hypothetical protein
MGQKMTLYWDVKQQKERISTTRQKYNAKNDPLSITI